ncbi:MAG: DUF3108 domain-containing protein [Bacteroidota bacterium]
MRRLSAIVAGALVLFCLSLRAVAQDKPGARPASPLMRPALALGEELEYRVSYSFFTIGTIRLKVTDRTESAGRVMYRAEIFMDSNPSLSWLADVHIRFYGSMDSEAFSYNWVSDDSSASGVEFRTMEFDYPKGRMYYARGRRPPGGTNTITARDTLAIRDRSQDGMSLLFFAREHAHDVRPWRIPTFVDNREAITQIKYLGRRESVEIDAVPYPVHTIYFDGTANFVGVFGLTGGFEGWFSNDEARIPIIGRMKVILGSVKVELTKWKRGAWSPPRGR